MFKKNFLVLMAFFFFPTISFSQDIRPSVDRVSKLALSTGTSVEIYRSSQGGAEERKNVYFHKPAFLFLEREGGAIAGWPTLVQEVEEQSDGDLAAILNVVSSTPSIRQLARDQVVQPAPEGDSAWMDTNNVDQSTVTVWEWPVTSIRLSISDRDAPDFSLAVVEHALTEEEKDSGVWRVRLQVAEENKESFQSVLNDGDANFSFDYVYTGVAEESGKATRDYLIQAFNVADSLMNSEQRSGNAPLFQDEKAMVVSEISERTTTVITATSADIIEHLSIEWEKTLFQEATKLSELDSNPELLERVDSYLERLVDTIKTENEESTTTTDTNETNTTLKMKVEGGWGDGWEASGEVDLTKEWKSKLETEHGISFKETTTENVVVASDIEVSFVKASWRQGIQRATTYAFISAPKESGFEFAGIVGQERAIQMDEIGLLETKQGPFVPVGASMCYFGAGDQPPTGFAFMDEQFQWPNAPWLVTHLRDQQFGGAEDLLFGSTADESKVGTSWRGGNVTIPGNSVAGSNFSISGTQMIGTTTTQISTDRNGGGWVLPQMGAGWATSGNRYWQSAPHPTRKLDVGRGIKFILFDYYYQRSPNPDDGYSFGGTTLLAPKYFNSPDSISGSAQIPQRTLDLSASAAMPNHVKCRWIVRVQ